MLQCVHLLFKNHIDVIHTYIQDSVLIVLLCQVREGLLLHPNIHLVSSPDDADVVVYLPVSADWHKTGQGDPSI